MEQRGERVGAVDREAVEALGALGLLAPFADQQALRFEPAQQRIERAFVDQQPGILERLAQRIAVAFLAQRPEHGEHQRPPPKLDAQFLECVVIDRHELCFT